MKSLSSELTRQFAFRLIHAQEEERRTLSEKLHDDLGNRIALIALSASQIVKRISGNSSAMGKELNGLFDQITGLAEAVREISHGLHPVLLRHVGIKVALKSLKEKMESAYGIRIDLAVADSLPPLQNEVALTIFRITQEALQNAAKHSGADRARVNLERTGDSMLLTISDDGHGFNLSEALRRQGLGLLSMEARALSIKGVLSINSGPSAGTEVQVAIPLEKPSRPLRFDELVLRSAR